MSEKAFSGLVVVGSSAGGIGALSKLVSALPEDFPAPLVIAQHLDPERESNLNEILSRHSTLPVRTVSDEEPLEAGVVFVVPANRHVNITDSEIGLQIDSAGRPKPSVDLLMGTAAGVYGERLIAVVLTGTGSDGTSGARLVSEAGGTVIIQNPETAEFGGMPGSLAPNTVDIVADLGEIGRILRDLVARSEVTDEEPRENEKVSLRRFLEGLREGYGVDFGNYKASTILRRLKRRMVATGQEDIESYRRYVEENPEEYQQIVNTFLIKVTEFFRDPEHFEYLKEEVLPELVEEARQRNGQLRIWSAGCATGEEAYSLAIAVSEVLGSEAGFFNVRIFATDLDKDAIDFARRGVYPASSLRGLSEERVERYFFEENGQYEIKKSIRDMIVFGEHDLSHRSPFPNIDLCVSRNVLIYFAGELQKRALQLFAYSLRNGGYLVLGKAETVSPLSSYFAPVDRQYKIYHRQGERFLMPSLPTPSPSPSPKRMPGDVMTLDTQGPSLSRITAAQHAASQPARSAGEEILSRLPVGVVIVDRNYDIQAINAAARRLLSIHGVAVGEDFLHAMQGAPYAEVRAALDAAFGEGGDTSSGEFALEDAVSGEARYLRLDCHPQGAEGETGLARTVVVVNDVTQYARERWGLEERIQTLSAEMDALGREAEAEGMSLRAQNERLIAANRRLEGANRELTVLSEQLQTAYEESLVSTEEAQAATEEVETLNEELRATNEELETLNEELQATIEELNTTNEDLQARSAELQEMARAREAERRESEAARRRLQAVLWGIGDAVLAVSAEGEVLFSNEVFSETFGDGKPGQKDATLRLGNFVVLDENGERMPHEATPQVRASRGESSETRFAVEGEDGERRSFEARVQPLDGEDSEAGGGVLVIREISEG